MEALGDFVTKINWVDIMIVLFGVRIIYIGIKNGFISELFKLIGVVFAIFITFHYYTQVADFFKDHTGLSENNAGFLSFGLLWAVVTLIFKFIRDGILLIFKIEALSLVDQWGGLLLSILRSALVGSMVLIFLMISNLGYWRSHAGKSFFNPYLIAVSPKIYKATYDGIVSKFFPTEKLNPAGFNLEVEKKESGSAHSPAQ